MTPRLILIRHPQTRPDPGAPAPNWDLSPEGQAQVQAIAAAPLWHGVTAIITSPEPKAARVGDAVHRAQSIPHQIAPDLREALRDTWLAPDAFEAAQRAFFTHPEIAPVPGWEPAAAAQARFVGAVEGILAEHPAGDSLAIVSHASVLALYLAHLWGQPPDYDTWRAIGFAAAMLVDRVTMRPLTPFVPAPYQALESSRV